VGAALMAAPQGDDAFRGHWLVFPISRLADSAPKDPPVTVQVPCRRRELIVVETDHGAVSAKPIASVIFALFAGRLAPVQCELVG
jgi:hypothetical protein